MDVSRSVRLKAPAEEVWALIGPFDSLTKWHTAMLNCTLGVDQGHMVRHLVVVGGIKVTERLIQHDDAGMVYRYAMSDAGRFPVVDFTASLRVSDHGNDGCAVTWSSSFLVAGAPESVVGEALGGIFDSGMNSLADRFGLAD